MLLIEILNLLRTDQTKIYVLNDSSLSEENRESKDFIIESSRLEGQFCSKIATKTENKVLEKVLNIAPIQKNLN